MAPAPAPRDRVLVVDDDDDVREILSLVLADEGYDVVTARNGVEALALLKDSGGARPRLVVLDLMMPEMNGWDFWDVLQRTPAYRGIGVVIMTATGLTQGAIGKVPILPKPVSRDRLLAAIAEASRAAA